MKKCILLLALSLMLTGCSASSESFTASSHDMAVSAPGAPKAEAEVMDTTTESSAGGGLITNQQSQEGKFIYTAYLETETTAFEEDAATLRNLVEGMEGYFAYASEENYGSYRRGNYTIRISADKLNDFTEQADSFLLVTSATSQVENISYEYYDTQGRLETQELKLERLQSLLEQAETMEDLITIESAISQTQEAIDNYSGTMVYYDDQVDYATVELTLREVSTLSNVEVTPIGFGGRLANAFTNGLENFIDSLGDFAIWLAYNWLGLLVWIGIIVLGVKVVKRKGRKLPNFRKKGKKQDKTDEQ